MKGIHIIWCCILLTGCKQLDTSIQLHNIKNKKWKTTDTVNCNFVINDSNSVYNTYVIVRHTNDYRYNNLFIDLHYAINGKTGVLRHIELPLTKSVTEWLGKTFNNIIETRIPINNFIPDELEGVKGNHAYTIHNIMREDPLEEILQVGMMVEKAN
jgi:gliding motility-associated lipoprotein GldH